MDTLANELLHETLEVVEACEGALLDHYASEDGLDVDTAVAVCEMCSALLRKHNRISAVDEVSKIEET